MTCVMRDCFDQTTSNVPRVNALSFKQFPLFVISSNETLERSDQRTKCCMHKIPWSVSVYGTDLRSRGPAMSTLMLTYGT